MGRQSIHKARYLADRLGEIKGVHVAVDAPFAREFPITTPLDPGDVIEAMADRGYLAGVRLDRDYPDLPGGILVAVTERRTRAELDGFAAALQEVTTDA